MTTLEINRYELHAEIPRGATIPLTIDITDAEKVNSTLGLAVLIEAKAKAQFLAWCEREWGRAVDVKLTLAWRVPVAPAPAADQEGESPPPSPAP